MPMISSRGRKALTALAVLGGVALAQQASALCRIQKDGFVAQDVQMDMGQVVILPSTPIGGVIKEISLPINPQDNVGYCDVWSNSEAIGYYVNAQQRAVAGFSTVYETGVAGVGIRVFRDSGSIQAYYPHTINFAANTTISLMGGQFRIQLIKIAAQTGSGRIAPNGRFTTYHFRNSNDRPLLTSSFKGSGTTVVNPTCEVLAGSRNIAVEFGSVPNTTFTGVGSKGVDRDFEIRLNCQGSNVAAYQGKIGIRVDADQDSSNMPGVLKLSAASNSASRIGVQVVQRDGTTERVVRFGQTINVGTTVLGTSVMALPLRARYVQTQAGKVGAGVANGKATFTIQYE